MKTNSHEANHKRFNNSIELYIMMFIFLVLFLLPVLFTRVQGEISWLHVFKIWKDHSLLIPIFIINHWLLIPRQLHRQKYVLYFLTIALIIGFAVTSYYYYDEVLHAKPTVKITDISRPTPIPPFAELLMYALLIVGVDAGLLFSKKWHETEEKKHILEKKNSDMQLEILRNQVSPHFFMNTLNNIYALIELDTFKAREAVMKLSKLMRYMLYENENGKVMLSKEFEFIRSYVDLMKLRYADENVIKLELPDDFTDTRIPPMLFIPYIENAFKYGASYENNCRISIKIVIESAHLLFYCENTKHQNINILKGGLGIENSKNRLELIYGKNYSLLINSSHDTFKISLKIPIL
ncbi:MAG: sensor histidine kinase [Paludibacter sp.]